MCGGVRSEALDYITVLYHFGRYLDTAAQAPLYLCQRARPSHDPQALTHLCNHETARRSEPARSQEALRTRESAGDAPLRRRGYRGAPPSGEAGLKGMPGNPDAYVRPMSPCDG